MVTGIVGIGSLGRPMAVNLLLMVDQRTQSEAVDLAMAKGGYPALVLDVQVHSSGSMGTTLAQADFRWSDNDNLCVGLFGQGKATT